jgi:hypothetical protein
MKSKQIRLQQRQSEQSAKASASNQQGSPSAGSNKSSVGNLNPLSKSGRKNHKSGK